MINNKRMPNMKSNEGMANLQGIQEMPNLQINEGMTSMQNMQEMLSMQGNDAREQVQDVCNQLQNCQNSLNQALSSVEKPENRQKIQTTLDSVNSALQSASTTLSNYQE